MAICNNDYNKEDDIAMWELHEIRHKMAEEGIDPQQINNNAKKLLKEKGYEKLLVKKDTVKNEKL